jgi:putative pyruvate formate lyase activating enzyme
VITINFMPSIMQHSFTLQLNHCECCPRRCGVNRLNGETGFCRIGAALQIAHVGLHFGEEPPISGKRGSGTVFFAGCNLRCVYCQNYQISQDIAPGRIRTLSPAELVAAMLALQDEGAHNINCVSPSHMVYQMADGLQAARAGGLTIPVVYNSSGYDAVAALRQIRGLVDIYLPDIKYLQKGIGHKFSAAGDYAAIIPGVLAEMLTQVGHLQLDDGKVATQGVLVRHLVLPGQLDNSRRCLRLLAGLSRKMYVSIMSQYSPQYRAADYPPLNRTLYAEEYEKIIEYALDLGLENVFIQEIDSQQHYLPDFDRAHPFSTL